MRKEIVISLCSFFVYQIILCLWDSHIISICVNMGRNTLTDYYADLFKICARKRFFIVAIEGHLLLSSAVLIVCRRNYRLIVAKNVQLAFERYFHVCNFWVRYG